LKQEFTMVVAGPSKSVKTEFLKQIVWCYRV
jgi:signal recognition particle receptor subunit beta